MKNLKRDENLIAYSKFNNQLSIWEKIGYLLVNSFNKEHAANLLSAYRLRQVESELKQNFFTWYIGPYGVLTEGFADMLYSLLQSVFALRPVLEKTILAISSEHTESTDPAPVEILFYTLYNNDSIANYPFILKNLIADLKIEDTANLQKIKLQKLEKYFTSLSQNKIAQVNKEYGKWVQFCSVYDSYTLEFMRRFNQYIIFGTKMENISEWESVTLSAVGHHLEELMEWVYSIDLDVLDEQILLTMNNSLMIFNQGKRCIENHAIQNAWKKIKQTISMLQSTKVLEQLIQLSYHDPTLYYEKPSENLLDLYPVFRENLMDRVMRLSEFLCVQVVDNKIREIIGHLSQSFKVQISELGIYTLNNNDKLLSVGLESFKYTALFAVIKIWLDKFVCLWIRDLLFHLLSNDLCVHVVVHKYEHVYKKILSFKVEFDKFKDLVSSDNENNSKFYDSLITKKNNEGTKHMMKVFIHMLDLQSDLLNKEFRLLFSGLQRFAMELLHDLNNNTRHIITDKEKVIKFSPKIVHRLEEFLQFSSQLSEIISLTDMEIQRKKSTT